MSSTDTSTLPTGTWTLDPIHSSVSFAVKHMIVATFRGRFEQFEATLTVPESGEAQLLGTVDVSSIQVKDENLRGHLGSPDFFDLERFKEITFSSNSIHREGNQLTVDGELTVKDQTNKVQARGTISGPAVVLGDQTKIGITLETVIDRTQFGLEWNAPLPQGGFAIDNEVSLIIELELALAE